MAGRPFSVAVGNGGKGGTRASRPGARVAGAGPHFFLLVLACADSLSEVFTIFLARTLLSTL